MRRFMMVVAAVGALSASQSLGLQEWENLVLQSHTIPSNPDNRTFNYRVITVGNKSTNYSIKDFQLLVHNQIKSRGLKPYGDNYLTDAEILDFFGSSGWQLVAVTSRTYTDPELGFQVAERYFFTKPISK